MGKRRRRTSTTRSVRRSRMDMGDDFLSNLPDEIIHCILSFLPLKDAVATSILSKRWLHLWSFNPNLNLQFPSNLDLLSIDKCLRLYRPKTLRRLQIDFEFDIPRHALKEIINLDSEISNDDAELMSRQLVSSIENWVNFAAERHVEELLIQNDIEFDNFTAPMSLFNLQQSLRVLKLDCCIFYPPLGFKGFPFLKTLIFKYVEVESVTIQTMLSNLTPTLQILDLSYCRSIGGDRICFYMNFKHLPHLKTLNLIRVDVAEGVIESIQSVSSSCPSLETLELFDCHPIKHLNLSSSLLKRLTVIRCGDHMKNIEIDAANLEYLHCQGSLLTFNLKSVSPLTHVDIWLLTCSLEGRVPEEVIREWGQSMANLSQAKSLSVDAHLIQLLCADYYLRRSERVVFKYLTDVTFYGKMDTNFKLLTLASFLGDCPSLEALHVFFPSHQENDWVSEFMGRQQGQVEILDDEGRLHHEVTNYFLDNLTYVTLDDFTWTVQEMALVKLVLEKAVVLKRLDVYVNSNYIGVRHLYEDLCREFSSSRRSPFARINVMPGFK